MNQLDLSQSRKARDKGIEKAKASAEQVCPDWTEKAYELLQRFLSHHNGPFLAEEVRSYAAMEDFPLPPSNRAWGGIMIRAVKSGLIVRQGYGQVSNPKAHACFASVWKKAAA